MIDFMKWNVITIYIIECLCEHICNVFHSFFIDFSCFFI